MKHLDVRSIHDDSIENQVEIMASSLLKKNSLALPKMKFQMGLGKGLYLLII